MHYSRLVSAVLVPVMLLHLSGCTTTVWITPEQLRPEEKVRAVVTGDGQEVRLDEGNLRGDTIYARSGDDAVRLPLDDVAHVGVRRTKALATIALVIGVAWAAFGVIGLISMASEGGLDTGVSLSRDAGRAPLEQ